MPEKLRVLRAITRLNIGGPAIHAILLTQGLQNQRFSSVLVTGLEEPHEGTMRDLAAAHGVLPLVLEELGREVSPANDLRATLRMYRLIRRLRPHILHTHMAKAGTAGRLAGLLARVPIVVHTFHGHTFHSYFGPTRTALFLQIERLLARFTDRIVAVGEDQRREIAAYGVAPASKIVSIPLGLEIEQLLDAERERGQLKAELGLNGRSKLVGIIARLVPIKAHEVFLEAAARVRRESPESYFLVIGDGERRAELERLAGQLGLGSSVRFLGWRGDMKRVYADLDVVALSSNNEGSPVALIEAMAAARPVVATRVGGVGEVVQDGRTGLLVPPREPDALARGILELLRAPERAEQLGQAGRQRVYPRYAASRLVADVERLYLDLARDKGLVAA
ncbi:MAG TPA: glycosyltransferase family 4 protein [Chloroflexota bacterium]|nr:glycosyltransferase family 4 protein [Chloroflexota bacterium]